MAYRKSNGKLRNRKRTPAVLTLSFVAPAGESYVDLALAMSIANRRGYKQQFRPVIAGMTLYTNNAGVFSTFVLPDTWVMSNAYDKTRALWKKMNDQVLDDEPSIQGAYHDFKIGMDANHLTQSIQDAGNAGGTILTPVDELGNLTNADFSAAGPPRADWEYSQLTIPNDPAGGTTTSYYIHAVGPDGASKGMVAGYAASRSRPHTTDPNVPTINGWMTELFDDGEQLDELKDIIEGDNNRPPYAVGSESTATDFYPGGSTEFPGLQVHDSAIVSATTVGGKTKIPGVAPMCGLLKFNNTTGGTATIQIHLMPGNHKGYMCEEL